MEKVRYMISDAASMVHVEAHVLRYWEDELGLLVPRNELGHRYYTKDNIDQFQKIKELKEQGYPLKEIRRMMHREDPEKNRNLEKPAVFLVDTENMPGGRKGQIQEGETSPERITGGDAEERMQKFRELIDDIVGDAIARNNEALSQQISRDVGQWVIKEMDYLIRQQEESAEERYRKLDEAIRKKIRRRVLFRSKEEKMRKKEARKQKKQNKNDR